MDPNANLSRQRELAAMILYAADAGETNVIELAAELAEYVQALDEWMTRGGFAPAAWNIGG